MKTENLTGLLVFLLPEIFDRDRREAPAVYGYGYYSANSSPWKMHLRDAVMTALGLAVAGFFLQKGDNWILNWIMITHDHPDAVLDSGLVLPFVFTGMYVFLPAGGWPFPAGVCGIIVCSAICRWEFCFSSVFLNDCCV